MIPLVLSQPPHARWELPTLGLHEMRHSLRLVRFARISETGEEGPVAVLFMAPQTHARVTV